MKKFLKWSLIVLFLLILFVIGFGWSIHEPRPDSNPGAEADALARKMLQAVHKQKWDSTRYVYWNFANRNEYLWDKQRNYVRIKSGTSVVLLHTKSLEALAFDSGDRVRDKTEINDLKESAWANFCNDSFWFNAPVKAFDPGTSRSIVELEDGRKGLMVAYESGGVTPGDAYVWLLDENGLPKSWKMWVSIIPIGGLEFTWENWTEIGEGAKISQLHKNALISIPVTDIKGGIDHKMLGYPNDPFQELHSHLSEQKQ